MKTRVIDGGWGFQQLSFWAQNLRTGYRLMEANELGDLLLQVLPPDRGAFVPEVHAGSIDCN